MPAVRVECLAPAKINLALHVTGRRKDGYHELDTIAGFATLCDQISMSHSKASGVTLEASGEFSAGLDNCDNLAARACLLLMERLGLEDRGIHLRLHKRIPVAAGLGGGSADAAAALLGLQALLPEAACADLMSIGSELGADIPMCLHSRFLRARGIGERIEILPDPPRFAALLVNPRRNLPTSGVFAALEKPCNPPLSNPPPGLPLAWLAGMRNDLEPAAIALEPAIGEVLAQLRSLPLCRLARMSGSGPTCFALFDSLQDAGLAKAAISAHAPQWWSAVVEIGSCQAARRVRMNSEEME